MNRHAVVKVRIAKLIFEIDEVDVFPGRINFHVMLFGFQFIDARLGLAHRFGYIVKAVMIHAVGRVYAMTAGRNGAMDSVSKCDFACGIVQRALLIVWSGIFKGIDNRPFRRGSRVLTDVDVGTVFQCLEIRIHAEFSVFVKLFRLRKAWCSY